MTILERIKKISGENPEIYNRLVSGYIHSTSTEELISFLMENINNASMKGLINNRLSKIKQTAQANKIVIFLLGQFKKESEHRIQRRLAYYINNLFPICSRDIQEKLIQYFLNSEKLYLRRYAYAKNLEKFDILLAQRALTSSLHYPDDGYYLLLTIVREYSSVFIKRNFEKIISHKFMDHHHAMILANRKIQYSKDQLSLIKKHFPDQYFHIVANKGLKISDKDALELYYVCLPTCRYTALLWRLSRLRKWKVLKKVIEEQPNLFCIIPYYSHCQAGDNPWLSV